jgi:endonuclease YncB( thermonuclease family)
VPVERDHYNRLVAEVFVLGTEEKSVQQEMLTAGMAYVYPKYVNGCWNGEAMKLAEAIGKEQKLGVWSGSYQKPWDYREQQ